MSPPQERRIALFIDFENLVTNTGLTAANFDLQASLDRLLELGKVIYRRAYCDWTRFKDAKAGLHELGVELIDVPPSTRAGKNSADMRLVIDALELNYARQHIDTFCIVSGDSDFVPLANKLRENDKRVIGMAVREATSPFFVRACDEFLYVPTPRSGGKREPAPEAPRARRAAPPSRGKQQSAGVVPQLAREVVSALLSRATGPLNPSLIKETMVRREPDFDERSHGFSSLARLLEAMEREGLLKLRQVGRQWYVLPSDAADPHGAPADRSDRADELEEEPIPDPVD